MRRVHRVFLENRNGNGITEFSEGGGIFNVLFEKDIQDPIVFWDMAKVHSPDLGCIVLGVLKIPSSSAQIERVFTKWSFVYSQFRNRLHFNLSK